MEAQGGSRASVLVVDDDPVGLEIVQAMLAPLYRVSTAASCAEAEQAMLAVRPDAVVLDYELPDGNALDLLPRLQKLDPDLPVVVLTAHGSIDLAVEAMRRGADHFFTKPAETRALRTVLRRCLDNRRQQRRERARQSQTAPIDPFRGTSEAIRGLARQARRFGGADLPVLLIGETGCGKGVLARWLHHHGPRASEPFVELNCAGLRSEFLESELFGHRKGAFTGAAVDKPGLLQVADHGTLFLDEIGDMEVPIQAKLLKVLEEQTFRRLGGVRDHAVDLRLLAATHHLLGERVRQGKFRRDLYFRINTLKLEIPPLRRRSEDVPSLAEHFLRSLGREVGRPDLALSPDAMRALVEYRWPGNIRELRNVLERAVLLGEAETLEPGDLHFEGHLREESGIVSLSMDEVERLHICRVLQNEGGSVTQAVRILDIPRSSFYKKLKKYGIDPRQV
ncbi:MAG: sigma-54 dependent transcriptional regulator [Thermoanaerobaculia bacterium]